MEESEYIDLVRNANAGDQHARERLFSVLYTELHGIADSELKRDSAHSSSATTLLHETFLTMRGCRVEFRDYRRYISYASQIMRTLVIDSARSRQQQKRDDSFEMAALADAEGYGIDSQIDLEQLNNALEALAVIDRRLAECIDLKFFCDYSLKDIARLWRVSERTVQRDWEKARRVLHRLMSGTRPVGEGCA